MGAYEFWNIGVGTSAQEVFSSLVDQAAWEHGHGGYTGTIAEKDEFCMVEVPEGENPADYAEKCAKDWDHWSQNKWGPAACVDLGERDDGKHAYVFFGRASSW